MIQKDLGIVTAYGYAVSKGYTGTEEEFAAIMADYPVVGQRAEAAATAAAASATAAEGSASSSAASATAAEGFAGNASTAAGTASQAATQAAGSATTASTASTAAQAAQTAAEDAAEDAETAAASVAGKSAQIDQNTADISLVKNQVEAMSTATTADEGKALIAKTVTDGTVTEWEFGETGGGGAPEIVSNASGAVASFADGADGYPVKELSVALEPIQSGTGDPSPDNVRPISGRQSVTVWRTGRNMSKAVSEMPILQNTETVSTSSFTEYLADGVILLKVSGLNSQYTGKWYGTNMACEASVSGDSLSFTIANSSWGVGVCIAVPSGVTLHRYSSGMNVSNVYTQFYTESGDFISELASNVTTLTVPNNARYALFIFRGAANTTVTVTDFCVSVDSNAEYTAPVHQSVEVQLGQTVYGGTVDVTTGELVVDRAMVDMGSLTYSLYNTDAFMVTVTDMSTDNSFASSMVCSIYKNVGSTTATQVPNMADFAIAKRSTYNQLFIKDSRFTYDASGAAAIKAALSGQMLVYPLATPLTVQLVGQSLTTLKGTNNVWSDADSVSVDYVADTKLFIEQLTEPDADMIADANITSGKYFMVGNALFFATANIASGAAITPGVNCTRTSLAAALNAINS